MYGIPEHVSELMMPVLWGPPPTSLTLSYHRPPSFYLFPINPHMQHIRCTPLKHFEFSSRWHKFRKCLCVSKTRLTTGWPSGQSLFVSENFVDATHWVAKIEFVWFLFAKRSHSFANSQLWAKKTTLREAQKWRTSLQPYLRAGNHNWQQTDTALHGKQAVPLIPGAALLFRLHRYCSP